MVFRSFRETTIFMSCPYEGDVRVYPKSLALNHWRVIRPLSRVLGLRVEGLDMENDMQKANGT